MRVGNLSGRFFAMIIEMTELVSNDVPQNVHRHDFPDLSGIKKLLNFFQIEQRVSGDGRTGLTRRQWLKTTLAAALALVALDACTPLENVPDNELSKFIVGAENPLNQGELNYTIQRLNEQNPENKSENYTATIFVKESLYKVFKETNADSFDMFIDRHFRYFNSALKKSDLSTGFQILRAIVVRDDVTVPYSHMENWDTQGVKDSDGMWFFDDPKYNHTESDFYNPELKIDIGWIHELAHMVLHLNDQYSLDYTY